MTSPEQLRLQRAAEVERIRLAMTDRREQIKHDLKGGVGAVAFVNEEGCIGCDQCTIVCDDDAIELYDKPLASPIMDVEVNKKARIIRDACTGCRLCVLACPTVCIVMIDR